MLPGTGVGEIVVLPTAAAHTESLSRSKWCPLVPPAPFHTMFEPLL